MASSASFFSLRALALTLLLSLGYVLLINVDLGEIQLSDTKSIEVNPYYGWYENRVDVYYRSLDSLNRMRSWRDRMFARHVANYETPVWVTNNLQPGDTVLLPPRQYAQKYIKAEVTWTDPRIFTYMTRLSPIVAYADTARRGSANTYIALAPRRISLMRRGSTANIDSLLHVYEEASRE
ncbi:MAG: hypothetical protein SGJ05_04780 [bacterium]|nr:hypothetical protein [bacterium]